MVLGLFSHYSAGRSVFFCSFGNNGLALGKAAAAVHPVAGVGTRCARVTVQSEVASLASLD